jgi:predicted PurR-regulated permease PerM
MFCTYFFFGYWIVFRIASPPYLVEEVVRRLITHVNINKKHRICMLFAFVLFVIVLVILIVEKKNDLSFLIKKFHRETCSKNGAKYQ